MTDYKEKLEDLHRAAKRKARELDEKLRDETAVADGDTVTLDLERRDGDRESGEGGRESFSSPAMGKKTPDPLCLRRPSGPGSARRRSSRRPSA